MMTVFQITWIRIHVCQVHQQVSPPNGDGTNDTYVIDPVLTIDPSRFPNNTFIIFNRWGNKVYEKSPYDNSWSGESNVDNTVGSDEKLPVGTYYYIFDYGEAGTIKITGFIYLKQ